MATKKQVKTQETTNNDFHTVVVPAIITATSNKVSEDFKQEVNTKTVYFHVTDPAKAEQLEKIGMTQYTPDTEKDPDAKPYFIAKATKAVKLYTTRDKFVEKSFTVEEINEETGLPQSTPNLYTEEIVHLAIIKVKGGKGKNDFFRLNAILLPAVEMLKEVEAVNPFADLFIGDDDLPF